MAGEMVDLERIAEEWVKAGLSRRKLLQFIAGGTSASALAAVVAACGGSSAPATSAATGTAAVSTQAAGTTAPSAATQASGGTSTQAASGTQAAAGNIVSNATLTIPIVTTTDIVLDPGQGQNLLILAILIPYIFGGFLTYDKDARPKLDLAEKFDKSQDGLTWTFTIRQDAKFATGRPVVADDFLYSWHRTLNPKKPSPASSFMEHMQGYQEYMEGKADTISGAKKIDDRTVQVTLSKPYNFFTDYMSVFPWFVVDKELVEKYGDVTSSDWTNHQPYGTGPWKVSKFDPASTLELVPNEYYYGGLSPSVTKLVMPILKGPVAANIGLNMFKAGQAQVLPNFPLSLLDAVEQDYKDEIEWIVAGGVQSVAMNWAKKPFDNVLVRRAFGMAIDRETFDNVIWRGTRKPTSCFTIPQVPNYTCPAGIAYNPDEAKKVLAAAGFPDGKGLPQIKVYVSADTSAEDVNRWRALADMWNKTLGADVQIDTSLTSSQILDKRKAENGLQMEFAGWISPTPETPQQLSQAMRSDSPYMKGRFNWGIEVPPMTYNGVSYDPTADSKKFDELCGQADIEQDPQKRNDLYHQAETLFLEDAVYVPFANYRYPSLIDKHVQGLVWGGLFYALPMPPAKDVVIEKG
ncbi:MAG TPA: peptide ABC transporter substrate-binding protein [Thermomicrobiaceae bacterium]|nr:peptide ABC transporter substrate-binding protein [Thermomicrobiaceae bacterium]